MNRNYFIFPLLFCIFFFPYLLSTTSLAASSPVIFFSDLTSGPNIGGQGNKGAFVTIWGQNFGDSRGTSTVTIGGEQANNYPEWSDTKVCFQLGTNAVTGNIIVTTSAGDSNGVPFTVRSGKIYFVTPNGTGSGTFSSPFSPSDYIAKLTSGEQGATAYFRAGTYSKQYAHQGWHANFCLTSDYAGSPENKNAFVAYPGEIVEIRTSSSTGADRSNFRIHSDPAQYIVVSKFNLYSYNGSISAHTGWRIVGNHINAIHAPSASGAITTGLYQDASPHNIDIYGNEISGGSSGQKLDHAIYPGSGVKQLDVGWNYIHDNNFAEGPMISLNCNDAYNKNLVSKQIYIHDNRIDVSAYPARAIGVFETGQGSTIYEYNNLIIGPAPNGSCSVYAMSGNVNYYNNTFYNSGAGNLGAVLCFYSSIVYGHEYAPESINIKNNIIYAKNDAAYYIKRNGVSPVPTVANNIFYNISNPKSDDQYLLDEYAIIADPLFVNANAYNFRLKDDSPALGNGQPITLVNHDFAGALRPPIPSIGIYENGDGGVETLSPPSAFIILND